MADIRLPVIGETKPVVVIVGAVAVAGGVWLFYRHRQNSAGSSVATPDLSASSDSAIIDPATGLPEGTAEDQAALSAQGGGSGFGAGSGDSDIDPQTGFIAGSPQDVAALEQLYGTPPTATTPVASGPPKTNPAWSAEVIKRLDAVGYARRNVAVAVGLYLDRKPLDAVQVQIIQVALAEVGRPPTGQYSIIAAKTKPSKPGNQVKEHTTAGQNSLTALAQGWHNTTAEVISLTDSHGGHQARFAAYVKAHNYNARIPAGIHLYYEVR